MTQQFLYGIQFTAVDIEQATEQDLRTVYVLGKESLETVKNDLIALNYQVQSVWVEEDSGSVGI